VARRTGTTSAFGARFDGEADAFLILVLSVYVGELLGWWVLVIGAARYAFGLAGMVLPWLRAPLPFRYWRKVVTAVQGVVLTVAAAELLPTSASYAAVVVALALIAESFGRDVVWLAAQRRAAAASGTPTTAPAGERLGVL
jgi:phosphatidylglycerophosphate synthase